jgi:hypothetical protein
MTKAIDDFLDSISSITLYSTSGRERQNIISHRDDFINKIISYHSKFTQPDIIKLMDSPLIPILDCEETKDIFSNFYNQFAQYNIQKFNNKFTHSLNISLVNLPSGFWKAMENEHPDFLSYISSPNTSGSSKPYNNFQAILYHKQMSKPPLGSHYYNSEKDFIRTLVAQHLDLYLRPFNESLGLYQKTTDFLEEHLARKNYPIFIPLLEQYNNLSEQHQRMYLSIC